MGFNDLTDLAADSKLKFKCTESKRKTGIHSDYGYVEEQGVHCCIKVDLKGQSTQITKIIKIL